METKHTIGPWTFDGVGSHFSVFVRDYYDDDKGDICQVDEHQNYPDDEAHANARLIAAAPEMLEALMAERQFLKELLDDEIEPIENSAVRITLHHRVAALTVAIRKATQ